MKVTRDIANELATENERMARTERPEERPDLLTAAQGVLNAWEHSKDAPSSRSAMAEIRAAIGPLYSAVLDLKQVNPDPEARIEQMIHELAYERVKHSYLFNALRNDQVDSKANELAEKIAGLVQTWIMDEVNTVAGE